MSQEQAQKAQRTHKPAVIVYVFLCAFLCCAAFLFARLNAGAQASAPPYDLLVTNARIVDGSGNPWFRADVAIKDGRIARIGRLGPETAA